MRAICDLSMMDTDKPCFCETSFGNNETGFANIRLYMDIMRKLYARAAAKPLCTQDGCVRVWPSKTRPRY